MSTPIKLSDWNFREKRLAQEAGENGGNFVSSESVLLLVSPTPKLEDGALDDAIAVALAQDISITQQPQAVQIFEVGSNRKYTIRSGRVQSSMNISRALFDGENLIRSLTPDFDLGAVTGAYDAAGQTDKFLINLSSSVFSRPFGLFMIYRDLQADNVGAFFCEECFLQGHQMQTSANSPMIMESIQLIWNALIPIQAPAATS